MKERINRLHRIKNLIRDNRIESQEELLALLYDEGYTVTQATLSRDLKVLRVGKISDGWSGYFYTLPDEESSEETEKNYIQDVHRGVLSLEVSGNIGVIKTRQGHADSVAFALDRLQIPEIIGSVAGDDTIMIVLKEGISRENVFEALKNILPEK